MGSSQSTTPAAAVPIPFIHTQTMSADEFPERY